jgi:hypothetical protein
MLGGIKKQIDAVKEKESVFTDDKTAHQAELDRLSAQKKYLIGKI